MPEFYQDLVNKAEKDYEEALNESLNPKYEYVGEWETRTGQTYPDTAPVWYLDDNCRDFTIWEHLEGQKMCKRVPELVPRLWVANHLGKPPISEKEY